MPRLSLIAGTSDVCESIRGRKRCYRLIVLFAGSREDCRILYHLNLDDVDASFHPGVPSSPRRGRTSAELRMETANVEKRASRPGTLLTTFH